MPEGFPPLFLIRVRLHSLLCPVRHRRECKRAELLHTSCDADAFSALRVCAMSEQRVLLVALDEGAHIEVKSGMTIVGRLPH